MQSIDNMIEYLASTIDNVQLPCLSGDDVIHQLHLCTSKWYTDNTADYFYTNMIQQFPQQTQSIPDRVRPHQRCGKATRRRSPYASSRDVTNEELELFRIELKIHRVRLGLTQSEAAKSIEQITNRRTSQTSLCRFENNQLNQKNMKNLFLYFKQWLLKTKIN